MSQNAESRAKVEAENTKAWDALTDDEHYAVRMALQAYQNSPGNSVNLAMWRGCRAYVKAMVGKQ